MLAKGDCLFGIIPQNEPRGKSNDLGEFIFSGTFGPSQSNMNLLIVVYLGGNQKPSLSRRGLETDSL